MQKHNTPTARCVVLLHEAGAICEQQRALRGEVEQHLRNVRKHGAHYLVTGDHIELSNQIDLLGDERIIRDRFPVESQKENTWPFWQGVSKEHRFSFSFCSLFGLFFLFVTDACIR